MVAFMNTIKRLATKAFAPVGASPRRGRRRAPNLPCPSVPRSAQKRKSAFVVAPAPVKQPKNSIDTKHTDALVAVAPVQVAETPIPRRTSSLPPRLDLSVVAVAQDASSPIESNTPITASTLVDHSFDSFVPPNPSKDEALAAVSDTASDFSFDLDNSLETLLSESPSLGCETSSTKHLEPLRAYEDPFSPLSQELSGIALGIVEAAVGPSGPLGVYLDLFPRLWEQIHEDPAFKGLVKPMQPVTEIALGLVTLVKNFDEDAELGWRCETLGAVLKHWGPSVLSFMKKRQVILTDIRLRRGLVSAFFGDEFDPLFDAINRLHTDLADLLKSFRGVLYRLDMSEVAWDNFDCHEIVQAQSCLQQMLRALQGQKEGKLEDLPFLWGDFNAIQEHEAAAESVPVVEDASSGPEPAAALVEQAPLQPKSTPAVEPTPEPEIQAVPLPKKTGWVKRAWTKVQAPFKAKQE